MDLTAMSYKDMNWFRIRLNGGLMNMLGIETLNPQQNFLTSQIAISCSDGA